MKRPFYLPVERPTQGHFSCLAVAASTLAVLIFAASYLVWPAGAQQAAVPYNLAPFAPDTLRPLFSGDDDTLKKLVLALESGPQSGAITVRTATADGASNLPARAARGKWAMQNNSAEAVYYGFAAGVNADTGWMVPAGASTSGGGTAAIYIYSASGNAQVRFSEGIWQ